jgi:hypothetical protein
MRLLRWLIVGSGLSLLVLSISLHSSNWIRWNNPRQEIRIGANIRRKGVRHSRPKNYAVETTSCNGKK